MAGKNVLILMGYPVEAWDIARDLADRGVSVSASVHDSDGLLQLERHKYDCVVLDSTIKGAILLSFFAYARRYLQDTGVVLVTDGNPAVTQAMTQMLGAKYCVPRPGHREVIADIICGIDTAGGQA